MKSEYKGNVLSWDDKDDVQRLLTLLQSDAVDALNTVLELGFVLDFVSAQINYVNKAPVFWGEVMRSLRFTAVMKTARLFDESKGAIGIQKVFRILENSDYYEVTKGNIKIYREKYSEYKEYIDEIRTLRDKYYAHNDKRNYQFWKNQQEPDLEFDGLFWNQIDEMLKWVRDMFLSLRSCLGDSYPVNREVINDVSKIMEKIKFMEN